MIQSRWNINNLWNMTLLVILYDMMEQVAAKKHENEMKTNVKMKASYASHNMNSMQVAAVVVRIGGGRQPLRRSTPGESCSPV